MILAPLTPSSALPPGPPEVTISVQRRADPYTFAVGAHARDPDGRVTSIRLCVADDCWRESEVVITPLTDQVSTCVNGHADDLEIEYTFPGPGEYTISATAVGERCPGALGSDETTITQIVTVAEPPPPHQPIPCSDPGEPAPTAPGVGERTVTLAATVTQSGPQASFLAEAARAMEAAVDVINDVGGVCDRLIELRLVDDGGDERRRHQYVSNFISSDEVFALVAQDSTSAILSGMLDEAGMPSVGTPAGARAEFSSPWAWPIGAGNDAFGWIAVEEAYDADARRFAVVYDSTTRWGAETAEAVEAAVASHDDAEIATSIGIPPDRPSHSAEVATFNEACGGGACDAVIYALDARTMQTWVTGRPQRGTIRDSLHPTLFHQQAVANCAAACHACSSGPTSIPPSARRRRRPTDSAPTSVPPTRRQIARTGSPRPRTRRCSSRRARWASPASISHATRCVTSWIPPHSIWA